jgi:hypothetical protein
VRNPRNPPTLRRRAQLQAFVGFEEGVEVWPVGFVHFVEGVQVHADGFVRVFGQEGLHSGVQFGVVHGFGQVVHDAFFVFDLQGVEEVHEHAFVFLDEPGAEQAAGDGVHAGPGEDLGHASVALQARLAFQKDGADVQGLGNAGHGGAVGRLVGFKGVGDDVIGQGDRHETEEFV